MSKNDIDKKLIRWNDVFDELLIDARSFIKDLMQGINYTLASGVIMIAMGSIFLLYNLGQFWRGPLFIALVLLFAGIDFLVGFYNILKFFQLKSKYSRLNEIIQRI